MSELRVALVAEGPTDAIIIEAALKALLGRPFVLIQLQPEPTLPKLGTGWGGVLRWCHEFASRGYPNIENDPTLPGFDLFVLHIDSDVSASSYANVGPKVQELANKRGWPPLPCSVGCPPPEASANELRRRLLVWAGLSEPGPKTVLCVPSKAIDAWLAGAILPDGHARLEGLECNLSLEAQLATLPKAERVKKTTRAYRDCETKIVRAWSIVRQRCSQAERFSCEVSAVMT